MKRLILISSFLIIFAFLAGVTDYRYQGESLILEYTNEQGMASPEEIIKTVALPSESVELQIESLQMDIYDAQGNFRQRSAEIDQDRVQLLQSYTMRELDAHQLKLQLKTDKNSEYSILHNIKIRINPLDQKETPSTISRAFLPVYQHAVDNFETSYLRNADLQASCMLIIAPDILVNSLTLFTEWKNAMGIHTVVTPMSIAGTTSTAIKNYVLDAYHNWDLPPDFLLLIGDVDSPYNMPAYYFSAENNVTDHPYTLLEGDDYFPELIVGRFTVDSDFQLMTVINKVLKYEKTPYLGDPDWFERGLLVAGNYSSAPPVPTTPVKVSRWLREKMLDYGYQQVDEVYYPPTYPGTSAITAAINNGVGFVSYRGWGDANGWHYPHFKRDDIQNLNNGQLLPVVTSIVCNTADFANSVDPCFGEKFLTEGTPSSPKGCVAIVGPSDLHTSTKYNNAIFSGFYYGLLDEAVHGFGAAVLRGKMEVYDNYPLDRESGGWVEFYYNVYNILGDPSLQMWTRTPQEIVCNLPDQLTIADNYLEIDLPGMDGAVVSAIKDEVLLNTDTVENGQATLFFNIDDPGEIQITVTKPNYYPLIHFIEVVQLGEDIGLTGVSPQQDVIAGSTVDLELTFKNFGTSPVNNVSAQLSSTDPVVSIPVASAELGTMAPESTATGQFQISLLPECPQAHEIEFQIEVSTGNLLKFQLAVNSLSFEIISFEILSPGGFLTPGEQSDVEISIENIGSVAAIGLQADVSVLSDAAEITSGEINFADVAPGNSADGEFSVQINSDCFIGRSITFQFDLIDDNGLLTTVYYMTEVGEVTETAPTGPDSYGYYAYDSNDTDYSEAPVYEWIEIDPDYGGSGEVILMGDDNSEAVDLPFTFTYYGTEVDSITICSNGWISFVTTWMTNFRNWNIPSALGPYAMVAAYWDDLIGAPNSTGHDPMRICYYYDSSENIFIIEWSECFNRFDDVSPEKFQIILYDPQYYPTADGNGEIQVNYHTVNNPDATNNYATVGIENFDQSDGILYTYADLYPASATTLTDGHAIKFTTDAPDSYTSSDDNEISTVPIKLIGNYPNPFNPETTISFALQQQNQVNLKIFNIRGEVVRELLSENLPPGDHDVVWNGKDDLGRSLASGIYLYRISTTGFSEVKKCILMK